MVREPADVGLPAPQPPVDNVRALPTAPAYDRVPPHNLDAEVSVIGAMLLSKDAIAEVTELLHPQDFYRGAYRTMFEAIRDLYDRGEPVDPITLADELQGRGLLEDVGGAVGISDVVRRVPTAANALHYARIVADHAVRRRLIDVGTGITRLGYDATEGADEAVDSAERMVYEVAQRERASEFASMKELVTAGFELIERLHENHSAVTGLPTGFTDLDELTAGLQPSNLVIVAARPSMGKCLAASSEVLDPATGSVMRISDVVARGARMRVAALGRDLRLQTRAAGAYHRNGRQPVYRLRTRLGREIVATGNHPLLTMGGWRALEHLAPGDRVATPRALPFFGEDEMPQAQVELLGLLIGDGGRRISSATPQTRVVPEPIFRAPREQVALFLNRLLACAGGVSVRDRSVKIVHTSASERLTRQLQHLLLRFGVLAGVRRLTPESSGRSTQPAPTFALAVTDPLSIRTFARDIGMLGKERALNEAVQLLERRIPAGVAPDPIAAAAPSPCRAVAGRVADGPDGAAAADGATPDVYWDEIDAIDDAGVEEVYDLTVPELHNFVADDIVVHNSTLVTNLATNVAVDQRRPVVLFSLEMSQMEITQRILASQAKVDSDRLRTGRLQDNDWPKLSQAIGRVADAPLYIDDTAGINLMEIRSKSRRLKQKHGLDLIIVDYLQLMQSHRRVENRVQEVSEISRGLKILAKELEVPVIALSQLSRRPEERTDRRPQLSDLRESGSIEQDADIVAFIYRDEVYDPESAHRGEAELIVAKHRNGPLRTIRLSFIGHHSRFANMARGGAVPPPAGGSGPLGPSSGPTGGPL